MWAMRHYGPVMTAAAHEVDVLDRRLGEIAAAIREVGGAAPPAQRNEIGQLLATTADRLVGIVRRCRPLDDPTWARYRACLLVATRDVQAELDHCCSWSPASGAADALYIPLTRLELDSWQLLLGPPGTSAPADLAAFARRLLDTHDVVADGHRYGDIERIMDAIRDSGSHHGAD